MRVLIETQPNDIHADAVCWALKKHGVEVAVHLGCEFPLHTQISVRADGARSPALETSIRTEQGILVDADKAPDVVWNRRPAWPELGDDLHPADKAYAARETYALLAGARAAIQSRARVLHTRETRIFANDKLCQLDAARRAGFQIPRTLATNDPQSARAFWHECRQRVIFKPFHSAQWGLGKAAALLNTTRLTGGHFEGELIDGIRQGPGIFQEEVPKRSELRVTVIGERCYALRIFSQEQPLTEVDWRCDATLSRTRSEATRLSGEVEAKCLETCVNLGLQFGCIDLVERPDGEIVFLEVNEMGQFLWVEESAPQIELLRAFAAYLVDESPERMRSDVRFELFLQAGQPSCTTSCISVGLPFRTVEIPA